MQSDGSAPQPAVLARRLSLPLVTLYGLGTTVGAGIYALTGVVAGRAGMYAPLAFVMAGAIAGATAFCFAELAARLPRSAGEAVYVREAFGFPSLAAIVGLLVALAGGVSTAAMCNGFVGYLREVVAVPHALGVVGVVASLGLLAAWGIQESVFAASVVTVIEVGALLIVSAAGAEHLAAVPERIASGGFGPIAWGGVLSASLIAFYAFLGFEDMVNVAEEVKEVRRVLPRAITLTLFITTVLYGLVALVAVMAVEPERLAQSDAPIALLYREVVGGDSRPIALVGVLAMLNGALIQIIMASRVLYGLSREGSVPRFLGRVHSRTRTPVNAVAVVAVAVIVLALLFPLEGLAEVTSVLTLVVFAAVDISLLALKRKDPHPEGVMLVPSFVPAVGAMLCIAMLVVRVAEVFSI